MQPSNQYQHFHRRRLPHLQPTDKPIFITFRLNLSMPKEYFDHIKLKEAELYHSYKNMPKNAENEMIIKKKLFAIHDNYYDRLQHPDNVLQLPKCSQLVADELHYHDKQLYDLLAFTILPNHVHFLFVPLANDAGEYNSIATIMNLIKGRSSRFINLELNRAGKLWQREYYDHYVRNEDELNRIVQYIVMNPVKAGLADQPKMWTWTWVVEEFTYLLQSLS